MAIYYTLSAIFHALMSRSARGFALGIQLDFQEIIVPMLSATVPVVQYTFLAEPMLQQMYWALVCYHVGVVVACMR